MAEESILLRVGIDESQIARSEDAIISARESLDALRESNKQLAAEGKKNTAEFVKNETAINSLNTTVKENQRILNASAKITKSSTGSIAELRANVSRLKQEYVNLSAEERTNEKTGVALQKSLLAQTEALKELEGEIGVTSRNVGNYTGSILEAVDGTGLFSKAQKALAAAQNVATLATEGGTTATQSFGKALILTGIGAFVVVLGSLISYLTQTQEGMDLVSKATAAIGTFVAVVTDEFSRLGKQIFDNVVPAFEGLSDIIGGILTLDFDQVKRGIEGVQKAAGNIDGINIIEVGKAAATAAKEAAGLESELQNLTRAEKQLDKVRADSRATISQLKFLAEDTTKSAKEREEATKQALAIEEDLLNKSIELQTERVRITKAQNDLSNSTDEDVNRAIDAEIGLSNLRQESAEKQIELNNKLNGIRKEQEAKNVAASTEAAKLQEKADADALKKAAETQKALNDQFSEAIKARAEEVGLAIEDSINEVRQQFADGLIDLDTYQEQLDAVEALALETRRAAVEGQLEVNRSNAQIDAETRIAIEEDLQAQLRAINNESVSAGVADRQKELEAAKVLAEDKKTLAKETADAEIAATDAVLNAAISVFGAQSAAGKIAASFQAIIDTYRGANLALATIPPPFGQIIAGVTIATGLSNVAKINSKAPPKFEEGGGMEISGPSHAGGGVDVAVGGRTVANVEGGEGLYVMKKTAFQSLKALSNYNQSFGGRSWLGGSRSFYQADGGAISRGGAPSLDSRAIMDGQSSLSSAIEGLTIITRISDIDRVNSDAKLVKVNSDLG
jgi:hypothetical protein